MGEPVGGAAGPHGREPCQRVARFHSLRRRAHRSLPIGSSATRASPRRKTSPAPTVTSTVPCAIELRIAVEAVDQRPLRQLGGGQPPDRHPSPALGRCLGDLQAADAGQLAHRFLAGGIDVEDDNLVGEGEGGAELGGERLGPRVEVGLEDGDETARVLFAQGREGGADLGRVVGVVVIYMDRAARPLQLQPAVDAAETRQRLRRRAEVEAGQLQRGERGAGVAAVVLSGDGELRLSWTGRPAVEADDLPTRSVQPAHLLVAGLDQAPRRAGEGGLNASCSSASEPQREW